MIGTIGAILIVISYLTKNERRLLAFQLAGSVFMVIYGVQENLAPVLIINLFAIGLIVWRLR